LILPNTVAFIVGATTIAVARHCRRAAHAEAAPA